MTTEGYDDYAELDALRGIHECGRRRGDEGFELAHLERLYRAEGGGAEGAHRRERRARGRRLLRRWGEADDRCRRLQRRLKSIRGLIEEARWNTPKPGPGVQNPNPSDPTYTEVRRIEEVCRRYEREMADIARQIDNELTVAKRVDECLCTTLPLERTVLELRFREGRGWVSTAIEAGISEQHAKRLEAGALDRLADCAGWRALSGEG